MPVTDDYSSQVQENRQIRKADCRKTQRVKTVQNLRAKITGGEYADHALIAEILIV